MHNALQVLIWNILSATCIWYDLTRGFKRSNLIWYKMSYCIKLLDAWITIFQMFETHTYCDIWYLQMTSDVLAKMIWWTQLKYVTKGKNIWINQKNDLHIIPAKLCFGPVSLRLLLKFSIECGDSAAVGSDRPNE